MNVLVQLAATVSLGRFQSVRAIGKVPRKASTDFQWKNEPRSDIWLPALGTQSRRIVSLRVSRGLGLVPIQFCAPTW